MPWHKEARDGQVCVIRDADGHNEGCHPTDGEADRHIRALYANAAADDPRLLGFFQLDDSPEGDPARSWIQVLITGEFNHPGFGKFSLTDDDLKGYAADIAERGQSVLIDFDHESADGRTRAAGWYTGQTRIGPDRLGRTALFAEVEWTPAGAAAVKAKEYRFVSIEANLLRKVWRDAAGKVQRGWRVAATALTNRPFLPDMEPVTLSDTGLKEALAPNHPFLSEEDVAALQRLARTLREEDTPPAPKETLMANEPEPTPAAEATPPAEPDDQTPMPTLTPAKEALMHAEVLTALGLPEHADESNILAAIKAKDDKYAQLEQKMQGLQAQASQAVELAKRVAALEEDGRRREIQAILHEEVRTMRVLPSEAEQLAEHFSDDPAGLKALVNARPPGLFSHLSKERGSGDATIMDQSLRQVAKEIGSDLPLDEESGRQHLAAMEILRAQGKEHQHTEEEYFAAVSAAAKQNTLA